MTRFTIDPVVTERFFGSVSPEPTSGCWLWTGAMTVGYGSLSRWIPETKRVVSERAHRISWAIHFGGVPQGMHVLHRCDNRACVNPKHLFLGSNSDNIRDRIAKGRPGGGRIGSRNAKALLTESQVVEMRARHRAGETAAALAREYGVADPTARSAINGRHWRHVPMSAVLMLSVLFGSACGGAAPREATPSPRDVLPVARAVVQSSQVEWCPQNLGTSPRVSRRGR